MGDASDQQTSVATLTKAYNDYNAIKMRLDTDSLLDRLEMFLRGSKIVIEQDGEGNFVTKRLLFGKPKASEEGVQSLLSWISSVINPHVVQGNFPVDKH